MMLSRVTASVLLCAVLTSAVTKYELIEYDPKADDSAEVVSGKARFTVLTDQLIRIEWSDNSKFEDRSTLAFLNRKLPVPKFTHVVSGGVLTIKTESVTLEYKAGQPFSSSSLSASGSFGKWSYGARDDRNLLGTIKSLDQLGVTSLNCTENAKIVVHEETLHCEWGIISRSGWAAVDDSQNWALDENDWWAGTNTDTVDTYLFAHGKSYKAAISDYTLVGGKTAMVPRQASGLWWTRWFDVNNQDVIKIVEDYKTRTIPLDIFVLDMDWHKKNDWSGFTFDRELFPYPSDSMQAIKRSGLLLSANVHDASGVGSWEEQYAPLAKFVGFDTKGNKSVPFSMVDPKYVHGLEDIVLGVLEDKRIGGTVDGGTGMDFWWIDWQQGGKKGGCAGGKQNPTIWTNKVRCTDAKRRGSDGRNMVLARWGGLGTHRYQVGFSGDVNRLTWENLAYQPYFSLTASNVLYGFWSHDIEGPAGDLEMYTRWVQWAAYSAVFRSHERGMSGGGCANQADPKKQCSIVKPWNVPVVYEEANRAAMQARSALLPHIYTAYYRAYLTGLSILCPMYYEYTDSEGAYLADQHGNYGQYFFGGLDMWVSPVTAPAAATGGALAPQTMRLPSGEAGGLANQRLWVPPGLYIEEFSGAVVSGGMGMQGTKINRTYALDEIPVFVRAGSVVARHPMSLVHRDPVGRSSRPNEELEFVVYPGIDPGHRDGAYAVYEDDGETTAYVNGTWASTEFKYTTNDAGTTTTATIVTKSGEFEPAGFVLVQDRPRASNSSSKSSPKSTPTSASAAVSAERLAAALARARVPATRPYSVRLLSAFPPASATCNGKPLPHSRWGGAGTWKYDGEHLAVVIECPPLPTSAPVTVVVTHATDALHEHEHDNGNTGAGLGGWSPGAQKLLAGVAGALKRANDAKVNLDLTRVTPGAHTPVAGGAMLKTAASLGQALSYLAGADTKAFAEKVQGYRAVYSAALAEVKGMKTTEAEAKGVDATRKAYSVALLESMPLP